VCGPIVDQGAGELGAPVGVASLGSSSGDGAGHASKTDVELSHVGLHHKRRAIPFSDSQSELTTISNLRFIELGPTLCGPCFPSPAVRVLCLVAMPIAREGGTVEEVEVPLLTLDEIVGDGKIDLLSIDVEGAELDVLESGDLTRLSPELIVLEDNTGGINRRVEDLLLAKGYRKDFVWTHNVFYVKASDPRHIGW
jgi:hypothetical protein